MFDHEKELDDQNLKHLKALQEEQMHSNKREEHLKNELEFLKTSFHSYKVKFLLLPPPCRLKSPVDQSGERTYGKSADENR